MNKNNYVKKLTITSFLIGASLILSLFSRMIYFPGGGTGMRIGISSYISCLPSFLFGPLWGGMTMGVMDVLAFILKPEGGFLLPITLTAILGGVLRGFLWKKLKNLKIPFIPCVIFFVAVMILGVLNFLAHKYGILHHGFINNFGKKLGFITFLPISVGVIGIALLIFNKGISKTKFYSEKFLNVLSVLLISNIIVTTINTFVLIIFIPSLSKVAFAYFFIPRLAEEIANTSIQSYVVSYLLKLSEKIYTK